MVDGQSKTCYTLNQHNGVSIYIKNRISGSSCIHACVWEIGYLVTMEDAARMALVIPAGMEPVRKRVAMEVQYGFFRKGRIRWREQRSRVILS